MRTKLVPLIVTILAIPASQAATTFSFDTLRATQNGMVSSGSFTFDSVVGVGSPEAIITYTLTADFDTDGIDDLLTFDIIATAAVGNIGDNGSGFIGTGGPRIGDGETLTYTADVPTAAFKVSSGDIFTANFDGFTGVDFGQVFEGSALIINGTSFATEPSGLTPAQQIDITVSSGPNQVVAPFISGVDFNITVEEVPEPSSTALLGLGALGFLVRRRR